MASTQPVWVSPQASERLQNPTGSVALEYAGGPRNASARCCDTTTSPIAWRALRVEPTTVKEPLDAGVIS